MIWIRIPKNKILNSMFFFCNAINPNKIKIRDNANGGLISVETDCCDQNIDSPVTAPSLKNVTTKPKPLLK